MKILLTFILFYCLAGAVWGQVSVSLPMDKATRHISYTALVPVAGTSQVDLLARARVWAQKLTIPEKFLYISNNQNNEASLVASGSQIFTYEFVLDSKATIPSQKQIYHHILHYTVKLSLQDSSYRYNITDFIFEYPGARVELLPAEEPLLKSIPISEQGAIIKSAMRLRFEQTVTKLLTDLKLVMSTPIKATGK